MSEWKDNIETAVERAFSNPQLKCVSDKGLVQQLHLSQNVTEQQVSVHGAYADGCQILIVCSFAGEKYSEHEDFKLLKDDEGNIYYPTQSSYSHSTGKYKVSIFAFDASKHSNNASEISLVLELDTVAAPPRSFEDMMRRTSQFDEEEQHRRLLNSLRNADEHTSLEAFNKIREEWRERRGRAGMKIDSFSFNLTIPFVPARILETSQRVEANGAIVRLYEIRVTPSTTRIVMQAMPVQEEPPIRLELGQVILQVSDEWLGVAIRGNRTYDRAITFHTDAELYDKQSEWVLTVNELRCFASANVAFGRYNNNDGRDWEFARRMNLRGFNTLLGPWVFKFTVPPAE